MRASALAPWKEPWRSAIRASALARWQELKSRPGNFGVYCGAPGCRGRLGTGTPNPSAVPRCDKGLMLAVEVGYDESEDGFWRYSRAYSAHHPIRSRNLKPHQPSFVRNGLGSKRVPRSGTWTDRGRGLASKGQPIKKMRHYGNLKHVGGGRIAAETTHVVYMICRDPRCGARNLVVPHLDVVAFPPDEILNGPCGHCAECVAHGSDCAYGDCGGCSEGWKSRRAGTAIRNPHTGYLY